MGLFDGLRNALRKDSANNAGRAQRIADEAAGASAAGLRQTARVAPEDGAPAKPKKARSKDFLEMTPEERKAWLAHPME